MFILQNFVGLSVADGYIATGSETNEVNIKSSCMLSNIYSLIQLCWFAIYEDIMNGTICTLLFDYLTSQQTH